MKRFLSNSYKELFGVSFGFATFFALLEIIGLNHPNNANIYDLYRCLRLSLLCIIGAGFILVCVILSFCHLRKQKSKAIITVLFIIDLILNLLILSNSVVFMIKTIQRIIDTI